MTKKQKLIQEFLDKEGFTDRIVIGMYEGKRICFHVDFSDELANGLITMALVDENIHQGLKLLQGNLKAILGRVEDVKPDEKETLH